MHVVGTAGHVDHGKTLLIQALTGIDTDRLPEEKARGLTIDLGFAHFVGPDGEKIGVIDVPGHERFIRNMVAGACGVDCALLVVAADEGWMQQTGDHTAVLGYLQVPRLIVVVTKSDLVDEARAEEVRLEALERCAVIGGWEPASIVVSAKEERNIDGLKELILRELEEIPTVDDGSPWLYIDRVFTVRGSGKVVTGSLMEGRIALEDRVRLLPGGTEARIRSIQSYYEQRDVVRPVSRVALNLSGGDLGEIERGWCVVSSPSDFSDQTEFILDLRSAAGPGRRIKNDSEAEIAVGTGHRLARLFLLRDSPLVRVVTADPVPVRWGQRVLAIQHGGSGILGGGRVVWLGGSNRKQRERLKRVFIADRIPPATLFELRVICTGYAKTQAADSPIPEDAYLVVKDHTFLRRDLEGWVTAISELAADNTGFSAETAAARTGIDRDAAVAICAMLVDGEKLEARRGLYYLPEDGGITSAEQKLSPFGKKLLHDLREAGKTGLVPARLSIAGAQKEYRNLSRLGLAVSLDGTIYLSLEAYRALARDILVDRSTGDTIAIADARNATGLSRKYLIPILNRMESDGYVRREGDLRIVLNRDVPT